MSSKAGYLKQSKNLTSNASNQINNILGNLGSLFNLGGGQNQLKGPTYTQDRQNEIATSVENIGNSLSSMFDPLPSYVTTFIPVVSDIENLGNVLSATGKGLNEVNNGGDMGKALLNWGYEASGVKDIVNDLESLGRGTVNVLNKVGSIFDAGSGAANSVKNMGEKIVNAYDKFSDYMNEKRPIEEHAKNIVKIITTPQRVTTNIIKNGVEHVVDNIQNLLGISSRSNSSSNQVRQIKGLANPNAQQSSGSNYNTRPDLSSNKGILGTYNGEIFYKGFDDARWASLRQAGKV